METISNNSTLVQVLLVRASTISSLIIYHVLYTTWRFAGGRRQRHPGRREELRAADGRVAAGRERVQDGPDQGIRERRERSAAREVRREGTVARVLVPVGFDQGPVQLRIVLGE